MEIENSLENVGKAISETIALRSKIATIDQQLNEVTERIRKMKEEIAHAASLKTVVANETDRQTKLDDERRENQALLNERLEKLKKAGFTLPLNNPETFRGFMSL